jgi:hypothetical protein
MELNDDSKKTSLLRRTCDVKIHYSTTKELDMEPDYFNERTSEGFGVLGPYPQPVTLPPNLIYRKPIELPNGAVYTG